MDLISIVLPIYNGAKYMRQSIESVLEQGYTDFELIIVNDCSTDETAEIIEEYRKKDDRIKVIENEVNLRLPQSLNIGLSKANGRYLTWTSDDNCYKVNALEDMYSYLTQNLEVGLVYSDMELINKNDQIIGHTSSLPNDIYVYNCIGACFLYRRECMEYIGEYNPSRFLVEDYDYWIRISQRYQIGHISKKLYKYRYHENSLTSTKVMDIGKQILELKLHYIDYFLRNLSDEEKIKFYFELSVYDKERIKPLEGKILNNLKMQENLWFMRKREFNTCKKNIIFGAGSIGITALHLIGKENVLAFVDNNNLKIGKQLEEKEIISFKKLLQIHDKYNIVIGVDLRKSYEIAAQLEENKIENYILFYELVERI